MSTASRAMQQRSFKRSIRKSAKPSARPKIGFMSLPAEIRNNIYFYLIPRGKKFKPKIDHKLFNEVAQGKRTHDWRIQPIEKTLALARTCKQLNNEVVSWFYGNNSFSFSNAYDLYTYLYMIGPDRCRFITSIRVFLMPPRPLNKLMRWRPPLFFQMQELLKLTFDLLGECTLLQRLYLGIHKDTLRLQFGSYCRLPDLKSSGVFDAVRGLKNLDLRVREVAFWSGDWAVAHQIDWYLGGQPMRYHPVVHFDQFDLPHDYEVPMGLQRRYRISNRLVAEEVRQFEIDLAADLREDAQEDEMVVAQEDESTKPKTPIKSFQRAEEFLRSEQKRFPTKVQPKRISVSPKTPSKKPWRY